MDFNITEFVSYLQLIGFPSIFVIIIFLFKLFKKYADQLTILMRAQKAQMRAQLLKDFSMYKKRGWISDVEMQEWTNQYKAYHELVGENGVLDDRYQQLIKMPNEPIRKTIKKKRGWFR